MNETSTFNLTAVGQALIRHDLRTYKHKDFVEVIKLLKQSDISFTNLETIIKSDNYDWPLTRARSHYTGSESSVLDALKEMGFNILSLANNHCFERGSVGIVSTLEQAKKRGFACAGSGINLEEASAPCYVETEKGTIALIAMASGGIPEDAYATSLCKILEHRRTSIARPNLPAESRPGINPLHIDINHVVKKKDLDFLKTLSRNLGQEDMKASRKSVGWIKDTKEGIFKFYNETFIEGDTYEERRVISEEDLKRNLQNIEKASDYADFVFVSCHEHHWDPNWQKTPKWVREFAHKCIDAGATAFIGHGQPSLRGIEIYNNRPIFYSLGNFIFHTFNDYKEQKYFESVISVSSFNKGMLESLKLYPIACGGKEAMLNEDYKHARSSAPHLVQGEYGNKILKRLSEQSKKFGTTIKIIDDHAEIR